MRKTLDLRSSVLGRVDQHVHIFIVIEFSDETMHFVTIITLLVDSCGPFGDIFQLRQESQYDY